MTIEWLRSPDGSLRASGLPIAIFLPSDAGGMHELACDGHPAERYWSLATAKLHARRRAEAWRLLLDCEPGPIGGDAAQAGPRHAGARRD